MSGIFQVRGNSRKLNSRLLLLLFLVGACQSAPKSNDSTPREIHTPTYDLLLPAEQKALLILFPCFPCDAADTRAESRIADRGTAAYL